MFLEDVSLTGIKLLIMIKRLLLHTAIMVIINAWNRRYVVKVKNTIL